MSGWLKVAKAASYAGVSVRTIRTWLRAGLPHSKPLGGMILISTKAIDAFLTGFEVGENRIEQIVNETLAELKR